MASVYILQGSKGRFYIGATENLEARIIRHNSGMVHSTKRLGLPLTLIASKFYPTMREALAVERKLKSWKSSKKSLEFLKAS